MILNKESWKTSNPQGNHRVVVTKPLPGDRWLEILTDADCRVEVCNAEQTLGSAELGEAIGVHCDAVIGQLTETWGKDMMSDFKSAGGKVYSNYAVGYNNVDVVAATIYGIAIGNTPGVLTETTAELAAALTFAAARRVPEGDAFMREGKFIGWQPSLFLGELLWGKTLGVVGAGRIGSAYAKMMVQGHKMNLVYYDLQPNEALENFLADYALFLKDQGLDPIRYRRSESVEEVLGEADVVSLHPVLNESSYHLIGADRLRLMKANAILINVSRGAVVDEKALVEHCRHHSDFRAGLDVYEEEPHLASGLASLPNVVLVPHIGSATLWTRRGMATLGAQNVTGIIHGRPAWNSTDVSPFLGTDPPKAAPSIVNAKELGLPSFGHR